MNDKISLKTDQELQDRAKDLIEIKIVIEDSYIKSALDKGISVGEMSEIDINNSQIYSGIKYEAQ